MSVLQLALTVLGFAWVVSARRHVKKRKDLSTIEWGAKSLEGAYKCDTVPSYIEPGEAAPQANKCLQDDLTYACFSLRFGVFWQCNVNVEIKKGSPPNCKGVYLPVEKQVTPNEAYDGLCVNEKSPYYKKAVSGEALEARGPTPEPTTKPTTPGPTPDPHEKIIVMFGMIGGGKSTFCRWVLGRGDVCTVGHELTSETEKPEVAEGYWLGKTDDVALKVIDLPGFGDTRFRDPQLWARSAEFLQKHIGIAHVLILVVNAQNPRFDEGSQNMLLALRSSIGPKIYEYLVIVFSRFPWCPSDATWTCSCFNKTDFRTMKKKYIKQLQEFEEDRFPNVIPSEVVKRVQVMAFDFSPKYWPRYADLAEGHFKKDWLTYPTMLKRLPKLKGIMDRQPILLTAIGMRLGPGEITQPRNYTVGRLQTTFEVNIIGRDLTRRDEIAIVENSCGSERLGVREEFSIRGHGDGNNESRTFVVDVTDSDKTAQGPFNICFCESGNCRDRSDAVITKRFSQFAGKVFREVDACSGKEVNIEVPLMRAHKKFKLNVTLLAPTVVSILSTLTEECSKLTEEHTEIYKGKVSFQCTRNRGWQYSSGYCELAVSCGENCLSCDRKQCNKCHPDFVFDESNSTECVCPAQHIMFEGKLGARNTCELCYQPNSRIHFSCPYPGATLPTGWTAAGYWRGNEFATAAYECPGGNISCISGNITQQCGIGYEGPKCSLCAKNFYMENDIFCLPCHDLGKPLPLLLANNMIVVIAAAFSFAIVLCCCGPQEQSVELVATRTFLLPKVMLLFRHAQLTRSLIMPLLRPSVQGEDDKGDRFMGMVLLDIEAVVRTIPPSCWIPFDWARMLKLIMTPLFPLVLVAVVVIIALIRMAYDRDTYKFATKTMAMCLLAFDLTGIGAIRGVTAIFLCDTDFDEEDLGHAGKGWLRSAYSQECAGKTYAQLQRLGYACGIIYAVLYPAAVHIIVRRWKVLATKEIVKTHASRTEDNELLSWKRSSESTISVNASLGVAAIIKEARYDNLDKIPMLELGCTVAAKVQFMKWTAARQEPIMVGAERLFEKYHCDKSHSGMIDKVTTSIFAFAVAIHDVFTRTAFITTFAVVALLNLFLHRLHFDRTNDIFGTVCLASLACASLCLGGQQLNTHMSDDMHITVTWFFLCIPIVHFIWYVIASTTSLRINEPSFQLLCALERARRKIQGETSLEETASEGSQQAPI